MMEDKAFLEYVVKQLVANPNDVNVDRTVDERGVLLTLNVNPKDIGYVIGKQGQTITALRTVIRVVGAKNDARVTIKVNEPDRPDRPARPAMVGGGSTGSIDTSVVDNLEI